MSQEAVIDSFILDGEVGLQEDQNTLVVVRILSLGAKINRKFGLLFSRFSANLPICKYHFPLTAEEYSWLRFLF